MKDIENRASHTPSNNPETDAHQKRPRSQLDGVHLLAPQPFPLDDSPPEDVIPKWGQTILSKLKKLDKLHDELDKLSTRLWYVQSHVQERNNFDERFNRLIERLTNIETKKWFSQHGTGYRPEPIQWEPVPGTWGQERRPRSPYRR